VLGGELLPTRWTIGALEVSVIIFATQLKHLSIAMTALRSFQISVNIYRSTGTADRKIEGFRILRNIKDYLPIDTA